MVVLLQVLLEWSKLPSGGGAFFPDGPATIRDRYQRVKPQNAREPMRRRICGASVVAAVRSRWSPNSQVVPVLWTRCQRNHGRKRHAPTPSGGAAVARRENIVGSQRCAERNGLALVWHQIRGKREGKILGGVKTMKASSDAGGRTGIDTEDGRAQVVCASLRRVLEGR